MKPKGGDRILLRGLQGKQHNQKTGGRPDGGKKNPAQPQKQAGICEWGLVRKKQSAYHLFGTKEQKAVVSTKGKKKKKDLMGLS